MTWEHWTRLIARSRPQDYWGQPNSHFYLPPVVQTSSILDQKRAEDDCLGVITTQGCDRCVKQDFHVTSDKLGICVKNSFVIPWTRHRLRWTCLCCALIALSWCWIRSKAHLNTLLLPSKNQPLSPILDGNKRTMSRRGESFPESHATRHQVNQIHAQNRRKCRFNPKSDEITAPIKQTDLFRVYSCWFVSFYK